MAASRNISGGRQKIIWWPPEIILRPSDEIFFSYVERTGFRTKQTNFTSILIHLKTKEILNKKIKTFSIIYKIAMKWIVARGLSLLRYRFAKLHRMTST